MILRCIAGDELKDIAAIIEANGWTPVHPDALAIVAYDDNKEVCGFHVLQLKPHAEPLWVREDMRGTGLAGDLAGQMERFLSATDTYGFMCVADTPEAEKLCKSFGMTKVNSPVYVR